MTRLPTIPYLVVADAQIPELVAAIETGREHPLLLDGVPFVAESQYGAARLVEVEEALRELSDVSVSAFIGWSPSLETKQEIDAKFERARALLAAADATRKEQSE